MQFFWDSFYPLYPPAEDTPLDFSLAPEALNISLIPDILILPSDMKYFVKVNGYSNFNVKAIPISRTERCTSPRADRDWVLNFATERYVTKMLKCLPTEANGDFTFLSIGTEPRRKR